MNMQTYDFGQEIKRRRTELKLSQAALALKVGVQRPSVTQ